MRKYIRNDTLNREQIKLPGRRTSHAAHKAVLFLQTCHPARLLSSSYPSLRPICLYSRTESGDTHYTG